jgi:hypothetical protein
MERSYCFFVYCSGDQAARTLADFNTHNIIFPLHGDRTTARDHLLDARIVRGDQPADMIIVMTVTAPALAELFMRGVVVRVRRRGAGLDWWPNPVTLGTGPPLVQLRSRQPHPDDLPHGWEIRVERRALAGHRRPLEPVDDEVAAARRRLAGEAGAAAPPA